MGRIIAIEPTFCEAPFLDAHIKNVCDYLKPDMFIIVEGMFPMGPESTIVGDHQKKFIEKYTLDGHRGFDWEEVKKICESCAELYPDIDIQLVAFDHAEDTGTPTAYYNIFTHFLDDVEIKSNDIILPLESDIFFTESQAIKTLQLIPEIKEGTGIGTTYVNFFETPKYSSSRARGRKLAFRYGDGELYHKVMKYFFWEAEYVPLLSKVHDLQLFHYAWMRPPGLYFDIRLDQICTPTSKLGRLHTALLRAFELFEEDPPDLQLILDVEVNAPDHPDFQLIPVAYEDHPKHIRKHPNFIKYYGERK